MASQKLSLLDTITDVANRTHSKVYIADSGDGTTFLSKHMSVEELLAERPLTGGDGIDITADSFSVDVVPGAAESVVIGGGTSYDGTYEFLGQFKLVGTGPHTFTADTTYRAFYRTISNYQRVLIWDETDSEWTTFLTDTNNHGEDVTAYTGGENVVTTFGTISTFRVDGGTGYRPGNGSYNGTTTSYSAAGNGNLEFVSGQLQVNESVLSITESQISDFGTYATLVGGTVPTSQLPSLAISEFLGTVADQAAMVASAGQRGDWVIRTDTGSTWILNADDYTQAASWTEIATPADAVSSVNGYTGAVSLGKGDVSLGNVDNTADAAKPISTAAQAALDLKAADAEVLKKDGSVALTADWNIGSTYKLTGLVAPIAGADAATKSYVDASVTTGVGNIAANDLTDVTVSGAAAGHLLRYNGSIFINTALVPSDVPLLDASKISSGEIDLARIPDLGASKITTGVLNNARVPEVTDLRATYTDDNLTPNAGNYYFLVVDNGGNIQRLQADFMLLENN